MNPSLTKLVNLFLSQAVADMGHYLLDPKLLILLDLLIPEDKQVGVTLPTPARPQHLELPAWRIIIIIYNYYF